MESLWEQVPVDGELMRIFVSRPEGSGPLPAVTVIMHQGGVDEFVQRITERVAAAGYVAAAPDLYHRDSPDCQDDAPTRRGRLRDVTVIKDVNATVDFLAQHRSVDPDRLGIVGFCMGGRVAYLMATVDSRLRAAVAYYGGNIFVPWGDGPTPFARTAGIQCPLMGHFGSDDKNPSPDDMHKLDAELTKLGKVHTFHAYAGAGHGFMNQCQPKSYRADADQSSWPRTLDFFAQNLKQSAGGQAAKSGLG